MAPLRIRDPKMVFLTVWFGELVSALGTGLTGFAMGVFVFQETGSTTKFALVSLFTMVPGILLSPFAGALADRWDRRKMMLLGNIGSAVVVLLVAVLLGNDMLELWHIYIAVAAVAVCGAVRDPAYNAAVSQLVPKEQLGRASGLVQSGENVGLVAPPLVAGILIVSIGLPGVLVIDFISYSVGIIAMLLVRFPDLEKSTSDSAEKSSLWRDTVAGWTYLVRHRGLLYLFLIGAATSFTVGLTQIVVTPLVLNYESPATLGIVFSVGGLAILLGGVTMAAWGGPRRRVRGVAVAGMAQVLFLIVLGAQANVVVISAGIFGYLFCIQIVRTCTATVIRTHVPNSVQARVFSLNRFVAWSTLPLSYLLAGPLANVFEPLLASGGSLASSVGSLIGTGPGRGIGFLLIVLGLCYGAAVLLGYANPRVRHVETEMAVPDEAPVAQAVEESTPGAEQEDAPQRESEVRG